MNRHDEHLGVEDRDPFPLGAAAGVWQSALMDDPAAMPVLVVATLRGQTSVRVFGQPSAHTADILEYVAARYRQAVRAADR